MHIPQTKSTLSVQTNPGFQSPDFATDKVTSAEITEADRVTKPRLTSHTEHEF